jgi:DNA-binding NtrC family response regulator
VARRHPGPIDLLVTDVVMAKLGGLELASRLGSERPGLRVLLVSGYSRAELRATDDPTRVVGFLQKPFTPADLLDRAAKLLAIPAPQLAGAAPGERPRRTPT